jgi:hypothetical protein
MARLVDCENLDRCGRACAVGEDAEEALVAGDEIEDAVTTLPAPGGIGARQAGAKVVQKDSPTPAATDETNDKLFTTAVATRRCSDNRLGSGVTPHITQRQFERRLNTLNRGSERTVDNDLPGTAHDEPHPPIIGSSEESNSSASPVVRQRRLDRPHMACDAGMFPTGAPISPTHEQ